MAAIVGDIISRVNTHFNEGDEEGAYTLAEKILWVNIAEKNLTEKLPASLLQELATTKEINLTEGKYLLPDDFIKVISAEYNGKACRIEGVYKECLIGKNMDFAADASEPIVIIKGNQIKVFPDSESTPTFSLTYIKQPIALTTKGSNLNLPNYFELIFYDVLLQAYGRDRQPEMNTYLTLYFTCLGDTITRGGAWQR